MKLGNIIKNNKNKNKSKLLRCYVYIDEEISLNTFLDQITSGRRRFQRIEVVDTGIIMDQVFDDFIFEECIMAVDFSGSCFRNSKFINCNIKTCSFRNADLTNVEFVGNSVCSVDFYGAQINGVIFIDNYSYGAKLDFSYLLDLTMKDI